MQTDSQIENGQPGSLQPVVKPRPGRNDEAILIEAAKSLAPKVKEWVADRETSLEDIETDLIKAIRWNDDGYDVARSLEGQYSPDAALVEILDAVSWHKRNALGAAEKKWVEEVGAQPIPIETQVRWPQKIDAGIGVVTANHPDGKSTVMFPSLGHVREGIGSHGYIVEWEKLEVVV